jgi:PAS domain S-box-containing protein
MNMQNYLLILNTGIALFIAGLSLRRPNVVSSIYLSVLAFITAFWSLAHLLYTLQLFYFPKLLFISLNYLFSAVAASALLTFSLVYSHRASWIGRLTVLLLVVEPLVTQILFWVAPARDLFFLERTYLPAFMSLDSGLWANINAVYLYNFEIASLLLIVDVFSRKPYTFLIQAGTLLAGAFVPLVFRLFDHVNNQATMDMFDHSIIGYSMAIIGLAIGLYRHRMVEVEPVTCETVVKAMSDGWMVLDLNSNIVEVNPAAEKIVGIPRHRLYGKPVRSILPDWPDISNIVGGGKELEMRRSIRTRDSWRYLNVRLSNLLDHTGQPFGQLIIWRDITDRKLVEEARQRARDEMFVLLNAISNAASHSIMLDDFLSESIYQIIYPFQSQVVAIFLVDEGDENHQYKQLRLAAHFGLVPDNVTDMEAFSTRTWIFDEVMRAKQPIIVGSAQDDIHLPAILKDADIASLVILPLLTQAGENSRLLGCLLLGRKNKESYSQDEVIRLMTIAEQIGNLVDSDRRRQLAIALSEREKLMRDLHDSVSQKLYGLVTLTEAAQAGLEAGSKVVPSQVLAKIGENARQAVKEMRLFLYQMQPVDLEKGDLVSALHHRLSAVEGRADIQARFMPDEEDISISKEKEVALYYIAQEALNNILKHARANSVLVKLRQTRKNVILEVIDNGEGFDPQNVDKSGIGLQNMKARTAQINGKLKIISKPGSGTTIKVIVGREKMLNQFKNRRTI